jgi:hypothetical protein
MGVPMRKWNVLVLAWWLLILAGLQGSTLILDRFHHLEWGRLGIHLLKTCYLGFAVILFLRYLSFRSQRNFELLVESYNRVAGQALIPEKIRKESWLNPFLNLVLVVFASIDFTLVFQWNEAVFKASVWLDFLIWLLIVRWLGRTFWLKTKGTRERLKEVLDDARSRMRGDGAEAPMVENSISGTPFILLGILGLAVAMAVSLDRWSDIRTVFRIDELKACMDQSLRKASVRFYQEGELRMDLADEPCVRERKDQVALSLDFQAGELRLRAVEKPGVDYFGDEDNGSEGLVLDAMGRFSKP